MPDRWTERCRRFVPASARSTCFDPAVAELECDWVARSRRPSRLRRAWAIGRVAWQCRRLGRLVGRPVETRFTGEQLMSWIRDVRFAGRRLLRQPLFALTAVLTLALGIGVNLSISSYVQTFLLAPVPAPDPDRLFRLQVVEPTGNTTSTLSWLNYVDGRNLVAAADLAAFGADRAEVARGTDTELVPVELVSGNYFRALRLVPAAGRLIEPADNIAEGGHPVVVLSTAYWRDRYAADPAAIGDTLVINSLPFQIIGVAPDGFRGTYNDRRVDLWTPLMMHQVVRPRGLTLDRRGWGWLSVIGRLGPDATMAMAQADLDRAAALLNQQFPPGPNANALRYVAQPASAIGEDERAMFTPVLNVAFVFTLLLLLVTCANLAGVLQSRWLARRPEFAIRKALGAGRGRLLSAWLVECVLLALAGGAVGLLAARLAVGAFGGLTPPPQLVGNLTLEGQFTGGLVVYAAVLSLTAGLLCGVLPAWRAGRIVPLQHLGTGAGTVAGGRGALRLRRIAVVVQVTLSGVLLLVATLLTSSLVNQRRFDPGFDTDQLGLLWMSFTRHRVPAEQQPVLAAQALARLRLDPDIVEADVAMSVPLGFGTDSMGVRFPDHPPPDERGFWSIAFNFVGPRYFATLGIPFVRGEPWPDWQGGGAARPVVINETMATRFWPDRDPVGSLVDLIGQQPLIVMGVVRDTTYYRVGEARRPFMYIAPGPGMPGTFAFVVRARDRLEPVLGRTREALVEADSRFRTFDVMSFQDMRATALFPARLLTGAANLFGVLALLLTAVGVYGVVAISVGQRTREIGVRMAVGASPDVVVHGVLREALLLAGLGVVAAIVIGYFAATALEGWLFGVSASDAWTYGFVALLLAALTLAASWFPARRAARIDPVRALRT